MKWNFVHLKGVEARSLPNFKIQCLEESCFGDGLQCMALKNCHARAHMNYTKQMESKRRSKR